jgi:hypothetical protein
MCAGQQEAEAEREAAAKQSERRFAQLADVPWCRDNVNVGKPEGEIRARRRQALLGKFLGFFGAIEALFLEDQLRHAVLK